MASSPTTTETRPRARRAPVGAWPAAGVQTDPQATPQPTAQADPEPKPLARVSDDGIFAEAAAAQPSAASPTPAAPAAEDPEPAAAAPAPSAPKAVDKPAPRALPPATNGKPAARAAAAPRAASPAAAPPVAAPPASGMATPRRRLLPTSPTEPNTDLSRQKIFLYGREKIGKSTFASQFPGAIVARCEDGLNAIRAYQTPIDSWATFLEFCREIEAGGHEFRTIVIDIVDNLYGFCSAHMLERYGVAHESDLDWGKGWSVVSSEFERVISKLSLQGLGLVFISHAEQTTIKPKGASEYTRVVPTCSKQARKFLLGLADHILFMGVDDDARALFCRPTELFEAGSRWSMPPLLLLPDEAAMYDTFRAEYDAAVARHLGGAA